MQDPTQESDLRLDFLDQVAARLAKGAEEYGNESFEKPGTEAEILEELIDVAGWAYVAWVKMRRRLENLELAAQELELKRELVPVPVPMRSAGELAQEAAVVDNLTNEAVAALGIPRNRYAQSTRATFAEHVDRDARFGRAIDADLRGGLPGYLEPVAPEVAEAIDAAIAERMRDGDREVTEVGFPTDHPHVPGGEYRKRGDGWILVGPACPGSFYV